MEEMCHLPNYPLLCQEKLDVDPTVQQGPKAVFI